VDRAFVGPASAAATATATATVRRSVYFAGGGEEGGVRVRKVRRLRTTRMGCEINVIFFS
jgi:hypothetical protein